MDAHERLTRIFEYKEADRTPVFDDPWNATIERWSKEGMPKDIDCLDFFGLDKIRDFMFNSSGRLYLFNGPFNTI
jgi:hypothetical protein